MNNVIMWLSLTVLTSIIAAIGINDATATIPINITRTLLLEVNVTGLDDETVQEIIRDGYTISLLVKGNHYWDTIIKPLGEVLREDNVIEIPITNNSENYDDGSDFRVDVWVNNYDSQYLKANYPIKYNTTWKSVDITDMLNYVLEDTREEKGDDPISEAEYSLIKDRPDNNGDTRPHAKVKDPKHE